MFNQAKFELVNSLFCQHKLQFSWLDNCNHRRRLNLAIDNRNNIGEFLPKTHQHIAFTNHPLATKEINDLLPILQKFLHSCPQGIFYKVQITLFDNILDLIFFTKKSLHYNVIDSLVDFARQQQLNLSYQQNKIQPLFIKQQCYLLVNQLKLYVDNQVFLQASRAGLTTIIQHLTSFVQNVNARHIADLYCGFALYSFALHQFVVSSDAFEGSQHMVDLARNNSNKYRLANKIKAYNRDLVFAPLDKQELQKYDAVIINPPRNGAGKQINQLAQSNVSNICYVSCNPYTLASDAKILLDFDYKISIIHIVNQFADDRHIELVANFTKK